MPEIKVKPSGTIKKLDKDVVQLQKLKNNIVTTKEKINELTINEQNNSAEDYAGTKVQNDISYISRKGIEKGNKVGKKSLNQTKENFIKGKQKVEVLKNRIKSKNNKELKNVIDKSGKTIKNGVNKSIKTAKNTKLLAKKGIKTTEKFAKNSNIIAKESVKMSQRVARASKQVMQSTVRGVKVAAATKAVISAIIAGGWIAVVIILVIVLIAGFVAVIFNSDGDADYDSSQIPNSQIVLVAKAQIGNEGGDKFWKWYGFENHVEWCACFVSWCANECNYIDKGIIPKFAVCTDGINWFKERNQWNDRGDSYYPIVGDIIFFDWYDENGKQDGNCDHVGIVTRTDIPNRNIYTIEGNTSNKCAERMYSFDNEQVMGYGSPKYE